MGFGGYGGAVTGAINPMTATQLGDSFIKDGPFGDASTFSQGGGWKGVLTTLPVDDTCVLMSDAANRPVIVLDRNYNSVFFSDVDIITQLGGLTEGSGITGTNDRLFGNLYAFLTGILCNGPPVDCYFYEDPFEMCNPPPATTTTTTAAPHELHNVPCYSAWRMAGSDLFCEDLDSAHGTDGTLGYGHTNMLIEFNFTEPQTLVGVTCDKCEDWLEYVVSVSDDCVEAPMDARPPIIPAGRPEYMDGTRQQQAQDAGCMPGGMEICTPWMTCTWTDIHTQVGGSAVFSEPVTTKYAKIYWPEHWKDGKVQFQFHPNFLAI